MSAAWVALYHFPDHRRGFLLTLAENREDYYRRIAPYLAEHPDGYAPLAPLPVSQWFEGYTYNHALWLAATKLTVNSPVQYIPLEEPRADEPTGPVEAIGYLEKDVIEVEPLVLPLVDFAYKASRDTPQALDEYFADLDRMGGDRYYAIIDASQSHLFPSALQDQDYPAECLFQGEYGEAYARTGPYLIELRRGARILKDLMTWDESEKNFCLWGRPLAIFLRSAADFQTVIYHLRKFVLLPMDTDPSHWIVFSFHNRFILSHFLEEMDSEPARLKRFFGDGLIRDFAYTSDNAFTLYRHRKLPENLLPVKIELGDWERQCFRDYQHKKRRRIMQRNVREAYPEYHDIASEEKMEQWFAQGKRYGYTSEVEMMLYLQAALLLCAQQTTVADWAKQHTFRLDQQPAKALLCAIWEEYHA